MIHIFAGENVCIHAITPTHDGSLFASCMIARMAPESVSTGFHTISALIRPDSPSIRWICWDWAATWSSVSGP